MNEEQKAYIRKAREILIQLYATLPSWNEDAVAINEIIAKLETFLGY